MNIRKKGDEEWMELAKEEVEEIRAKLAGPRPTLQESIEAQLKQRELWLRTEAEEDAAWREGMQVRLAELRQAYFDYDEGYDAGMDSMMGDPFAVADNVALVMAEVEKAIGRMELKRLISRALADRE